jgi:hypothetical protein
MGIEITIADESLFWKRCSEERHRGTNSFTVPLCLSKPESPNLLGTKISVMVL